MLPTSKLPRGVRLPAVRSVCTRDLEGARCGNKTCGVRCESRNAHTRSLPVLSHVTHRLVTAESRVVRLPSTAQLLTALIQFSLLLAVMRSLHSTQSRYSILLMCTRILYNPGVSSDHNRWHLTNLVTTTKGNPRINKQICAKSLQFFVIYC